MKRLALAASLLLCAATTSSARPVLLGKSLASYQRLYWTWALGGSTVDHHGKVVFMPIPGGELDPSTGLYVGSLETSLKKNEYFFLPIYVFTGESYLDGSPSDDPSLVPSSVFSDAEVHITLDGVPIIDSAVDDLARFYVDTTYFPRPVVYPEPTPYGADAAVWVKGLGFLQSPLARGHHVLDLLVKSDFLIPFGFNGYHNTWHITVK